MPSASPGSTPPITIASSSTAPDMRIATRAGAVRLTKEADATLLTPLPGGARFEIRLRIQNPARLRNGAIVIDRDPTVFAYRLVD